MTTSTEAGNTPTKSQARTGGKNNAVAQKHSATSGQRKQRKGGKGKKAITISKATEPLKAIREGSKTSAVLALIERPQGEALTEIKEITGWQSHSVRGFISGTLSKQRGLRMISTRREDGERVYRIAPATRAGATAEVPANEDTAGMRGKR